jgi:hypothetical protein
MKIVDATVSMIASSAVDCGFKPGRVKPKTITFIFVASPQRVRANTG